MLRIQDLRLKTKRRLLLDSLNGEILPGECWAIIGKNGAGKTTLLRTLAGLRQPDAGEILLNDQPLSEWNLSSVARQRAYLPQIRHDAFSYSVLQTVLAGRHPWHDRRYRETETDLDKVYEAMQQMDVLPLAERDIRTLSGGERQRVALAAVLAQDTPLLLLDEPASSLDLAHQAALMQVVGKLCREKQKSVIMVVHDLNLIQGIATHALLLEEEGRWHAGKVTDVMQSEQLSACLGYPVTQLWHESRPIYVLA